MSFALLVKDKLDFVDLALVVKGDSLYDQVQERLPLVRVTCLLLETLLAQILMFMNIGIGMNILISLL